MGCLSGCFGRGKNSSRRQRRRESFQPRLNRISEECAKDDHLNVRVPTVEEVPKISVIPIIDICDKAEEKRSSLSPTEIRVTSDSKAKAYEHIVPEKSVKVSNKNEEKYTPASPTRKRVTSDSKVKNFDHIAPEESVKVSDKTKEECSPSPTRKRVTFDSKVKTYEHIVLEESVELLEENKEDVVKPEKNLLKSSQTQCSSENSDITSNSSGSYPSNHRYQNCRESDDETDNETDCGESDLEDLDEDDGFLHDGFYSDDDKFEDKLHKWGKEVYTEEIADNVLDIEGIKTKTKASKASARDRSGYVHAVLNPVENLTQWKAMKSKGRTIQSQFQKENASLISDQEDHQVEEFSAFSFKPRSKDESKKQRNQEVAVDASLSTWLSTTTSSCSSVSVGVETATSEKKYTCSYSKPSKSHDDRPILGALTAEEIKQFSATNSPRKSPSRSPDSPIIGTVGGYWNHHSRTARD